MLSIGIHFLIFTITLCSITEGSPVDINRLPLLHQACEIPTRNGVISNGALDVSPFRPVNGLNVFFCNAGEPIPPAEAMSALRTMITDIMPNLRHHPWDPIPDNTFQKGKFFKPTGDRVAVFVHTVRDEVLSWLELAQILTEIETYMVGPGGGPRTQHFQELAFHVRSHEGEIAVGRVQFVPRDIPTGEMI